MAVLVGRGQAVLVLLCAMAGSLAASEIWVRTSAVSARLDAKGRVSSLKLSGKSPRDVHAETRVDGCRVRSVHSFQRRRGGVEFRKSLLCEAGHTLEMTERYSPGSAGSIRWSVHIAGDGTPWSAPIRTTLQYPRSPGLRFWTAWSNPTQENTRAWRDPLVPVALRNATWYYGAPPFRHENPLVSFIPFGGDLFSVPLATVLDAHRDEGLSIALCPADRILDLALSTTAEGDISFARLNHRLGTTAGVQFSLDLVAHEADWRGGLRWLTGRYPEFFDPPNPLAHELAGTAAYSTSEEPLDAAKYTRMAFRMNWKASFDLPYMGMFLPPVAPHTRWNRFSFHNAHRWSGSETAPNGTTSIAQMEAYSERMRSLGFYVLNYFNVTEFGAFMQYPQPARVTAGDVDLWKDANDFLYARLKDAILFVPAEVPPRTLLPAPGSRPGGPYVSWGDALVMDCGEPAYRAYLLEQARRHIVELPASSGICIDRLDWLRLYNERRDDGQSWVEGRSARSLYVSWDELMRELGPLIHGAGKVIFCNNHDKRLDLLRHIDGIYDEFGYAGAPLNLTALLAVRKPAVAWTAGEEDLHPDPDAFFQRYLYMGVYPTAPIPGNDHAIAPSPSADRWYLDYGMLLDAMRGRKWVLTPHAVSVEGPFKANLFEVADGYVVPVTFGGDRTEARVSVRIPSGSYAATVLYPGEAAAVPFPIEKHGQRVDLVVPLKRGCALVKLQRLAGNLARKRDADSVDWVGVLPVDWRAFGKKGGRVLP